jgi:hypothetical protein
VARDEDTARREVQTTVPLMLRGVAKKDTESGTGGQLMRRSGSYVGVTSAPKHTKVIVAGRGTEKSVVWCRGRGIRGGQAIKEIGGGVEALNPEASGKRGL